MLLAVVADARAENSTTTPYYSGYAMSVPVLRRRACGSDYSVPYKRGIAILSPVESPDAYNPPVGGRVRITPYYPDYCPHRHHGPRVLVPGYGYGWSKGASGDTITGMEPGDIEPTNYANYSGANRDEARLLRLGGTSNAAADQTTETAPDLIDMIRLGQ